jgi:predicted ATP-dependent endonuclease of OLD family
MRFRIHNFRGIQSTEINIDVRKTSDVITLIGLNESGKTSILEALSHFSTGDRTIPNLVARYERREHLISLIPIDRRAAFTDRIKICADIAFSGGEFQKYLDAAEKKFAVNLQLSAPIEEISVEKVFDFKDSAYQGQSNFWDGIEFKIKERGKKSLFHM